MKKLVVLLLAFAVAGAAFAQTPALSAYSTLSFGIDLDTGYAGFKNTNSATFKVPFVLGNQAKKGDKGWWGDISVSNLTFILSDDALTTVSATVPSNYVDTLPGLKFQDWNDIDADGVKDSGEYATLSAFITNGTWKVSVNSKNGFDYSNADALYDGSVDATLDADTAGTTVSYTAGALTVGATAASKGDWTANTKNEFAFGTNASFKVSSALTVSGAVAYDMLDASKQFGATASVAYSAAPLTVSVISDVAYLTALEADVYGKVGYNVMTGLDATVKGFYSTLDDDLEVYAELAYAVAPVELTVWFGLYDPLTTMVMDLGIDAGYTYAIDGATSLYVYAEYLNDLAGAQSLVPYAQLKNTSITNTTLTLTYNDNDVDVLASKFGTLVAAAKVTL